MARATKKLQRPTYQERVHYYYGTSNEEPTSSTIYIRRVNSTTIARATKNLQRPYEEKEHNYYGTSNEEPKSSTISGKGTLLLWHEQRRTYIVHHIGKGDIITMARATKNLHRPPYISGEGTVLLWH